MQVEQVATTPAGLPNPALADHAEVTTAAFSTAGSGDVGTGMYCAEALAMACAVHLQEKTFVSETVQ